MRLCSRKGLYCGSSIHEIIVLIHGDNALPSEITDAEKFVEFSANADYCAVKRLKDMVKLKLKTPSRLYTLKVTPTNAEVVIKKLQCEVREI